MTSDDKDMLAAEYVLGTLSSARRTAFQAKLVESDELQQLVAAWEERLGDLRNSVAPIKPPAQVWTAISERLGFSKPKQSSAWLNWWRGLALAATAASIIMAVVLVQRVPQVSVEPQIVEVPVPDKLIQSVVVRSKDQTPLWLVELDFNREQVAIEPVSAQPAGDEKDYELWLLGAQGDAPVSLGLLPVDARSAITIPLLAAREAKASAVAVSLEPTGGSPTGQPTGPVLYVAPLGST